MATRVLQIDGMSCGHCVKAVTMALQEVAGVDVKGVTIGTATIEADDPVIESGRLAQAIDEAGYTLVQMSPA